MNHLESSFIGKNAFWRYFVMLITVFVATNTIGAIPLLLGIGIKSVNDPEIIERLSADSGNLSQLGFDANMSLALNVFPFIVGLAAFILLMKPLNDRSWKMVINGTDSFRWKRFFISALVWIFLSTVYLFVFIRMDPFNFSLNNTSSSILILALVSMLLIPFQASFEEIIFRGYLMQGFTVIFRNRFFPLIITALLFGLMHGLNPEVKAFGFWVMMPQYILFGLIFGLITLLDDGIEAAMGAHTANNVFLLIMNTNESSALQSDALYVQHTIYHWVEFAALFIMGFLAIMILKRLFKWNNLSFLSGSVEKADTPDHIS